MVKGEQINKESLHGVVRRTDTAHPPTLGVPVTKKRFPSATRHVHVSVLSKNKKILMKKLNSVYKIVFSTMISDMSNKDSIIGT